MVHQIIKKKFFIIFLVMISGLSSCYYDNVEYLYPQDPDCDTTNVTFSNDVMPVISASCTGCHSGSAPAGNIRLSNYDEIVSVANNGSLMGTIKHESGWSPMPKNGNKLSDCKIQKIDRWILDGTPNN
ncbi:MAG: hypothetical protein HN336_06610 [Lentimicrobiaceae bacterium]|jgi:hypothetical protein|nr:hypothetical protein [Lentimicrobiaceae bacterium]MBT3453375.1 hypothetical protein [Lentimicrobiaceae bacterium]MBT3819262.1 hypothetical protein [Lentimicrobiaceae bacterium]MBT4061054.1 hypothetical protein [Lentimicrobiaceae bacterium]MBT4190001.1 hypothetical protein [Lentimicrobiaceae bacterium]